MTATWKPAWWEAFWEEWGSAVRRVLPPACAEMVIRNEQFLAEMRFRRLHDKGRQP